MAAPINKMARLSVRRICPILTVQCPLISTPRCLDHRQFSNSADTSQASTKEKISRAMRAYLARSKAHDEFMKQETHEFNVGKRHLANMMGADPETFSQEDIDESIRYLLPSGLFEKKARPIMRPPEEVFPKTKAAEFDESGRPFHHLFYTSRPNFSTLLHECADKLAELDSFEDQMIRQQRKPDPEQANDHMGSMWITKDALEKKILEKLVDVEFEKFIAAMERIIQHPYGYRAADFVRQYRVQLMAERKQVPIAEPQVAEDGRRFVTVKDCKRKSTWADVTVTVPGTGKFIINGQGIDYFKSDVARHQGSVVREVRRPFISVQLPSLPHLVPQIVVHLSSVIQGS